RGSIFSRLSWRQSGWNSCGSWCPVPFVPPCSSIRRMPRLPRPQVKDVEAASRAMGLQIQVFNASTSREIDATFASFGRERPDALFVSTSPFLTDRRVQLALLAVLHRVPAIYAVRDFVEVGGLMSYGASLRDAYRQIGVYSGRILKGTKPAALPVVQS